MSKIEVIGGLLIANGRVLLTQRAVSCVYAYAWEHPGGKLDVGEDPHAALARELLEELGIIVDETAISEQPVAGYAFKRERDGQLVEWSLYRVLEWQGCACPREGQGMAYWSPMEVESLFMTPASDAARGITLRHLWAWRRADG